MPSKFKSVTAFHCSLRPPVIFAESIPAFRNRIFDYLDNADIFSGRNATDVRLPAASVNRMSFSTDAPQYSSVSTGGTCVLAGYERPLL